MDVVDFNKLGTGEVLTLKIEECDDTEEIYQEDDNLIEEMTEDLLNALSDEDSCPHCEIRDMLTTLWNIAYEQGYDDSTENIREEILGVFEK